MLQSGRLNEIKHNPQSFIDLVSEKILMALNELMVNGIEYDRLPDNREIYRQSLTKWRDLEQNGAEFFLNPYTFEVNQVDEVKQQKTIFADYIALDSETEKQFAANCESHEDVRLYFKLPRWFQIATPIGAYNPDWAIVMRNREQIYFVAETKNTGKGVQEGVDYEKLSSIEQQKIECAKQHFAVFDGVEYKVIQKLSEL